MSRFRYLLFFAPLAACFLLPQASLAESPAEQPAWMNAPAADVAAWRKLKFGLFVHWGPVSLKGTEIGWSRGGERRGRSGRGQIPVEVYDNLYKQFNPVRFDARQWVETAKAAGMRYLVFTTKHHDGFCMYDSKLTDYKITSPESPYRRDIVAQLADACHQGGVLWGIYYSPPDWYHADYRNGPRHQAYIEYMHGQLRELLTGYGKVNMIFFDGLGGKPADWDSPRLIEMCRQLQPQVIINNRTGVPCDNDTPEQRIGRMQTDRPWETCMTICRQWAYKPNDRMKSLKECLDVLVRVVGGDGNLLFNVGPMPDGRIEPRQVTRLKEMGQWLQQYGQTIYDTRGGPFRPASWGASTYRGNTVYVHVLDPTAEKVVLPPIPTKILASRLLTGGTADVQQTDEAIEISVPPQHRQEIDTIVALTLDGPAAELTPVRFRSGSVAADGKATASNVYRNMADEYGPQMAFDDDPGTRWATDVGTASASLEVDLGKPKRIDRAYIAEAYAPRVQQFELQSKEGGQWKTFAAGEQIGEHLRMSFEPVTVETVRLSILRATEGPTIWEFQLFKTKECTF